MADKTIKQLTTEITSMAADDWVIVQRDSDSVTAKVKNSNLLADGTVTNDNLSVATGELGGAWQSYAPTWASSGTQPAIGNGSIAGFYQKIGRTVRCRVLIVVGTTTTGGSGTYTISVPTPMLAASDASAVSVYMPLGQATLYDASNTGLPGWVRFSSTTAVAVGTITTFSGTNPVNLNSTAAVWSATNPAAPASGDRYAMNFEYEAGA